MKIRDLLKILNRPVIVISPGETISAAIKKLVDNNIGALPVCDGDKLLGIVSERDLLKDCYYRASAINTTRVQDVMIREIAVGTPDDDLKYVTSVMKQKRIRHLPIVIEKKLVGMVSIRDIIDTQLEEVTAEIRYFGLIRGKPPRPLV